jgi:hypothetical protein
MVIFARLDAIRSSNSNASLEEYLPVKTSDTIPSSKDFASIGLFLTQYKFEDFAGEIV